MDKGREDETISSQQYLRDPRFIAMSILIEDIGHRRKISPQLFEHKLSKCKKKHREAFAKKVKENTRLESALSTDGARFRELAATNTSAVSKPKASHLSTTGAIATASNIGEQIDRVLSGI